MTRCLLADADSTDRRLLSDLLRDANAIVVGETAHATALRAMLPAARPDVVFVDARMPPYHITAIDDAARATGSLIVVISAMPSDAVLGFRLRAVDFLLKPYSRPAVRLAMVRVRARLDELALLATARNAVHASLTVARGAVSHRDDATRIAVTVAGSVEYVALASIEWIAAAGYGAHVHMADRLIGTRTSFTAMLRQIGGRGFLRTHRGTVVNLHAVRRLDVRRGGTGALTLGSGRTLPVAKRRLAAVRRALGGATVE